MNILNHLLICILNYLRCHDDIDKRQIMNPEEQLGMKRSHISIT